MVSLISNFRQTPCWWQPKSIIYYCVYPREGDECIDPAVHHPVKYLMFIPITEIISDLDIDSHWHTQISVARGAQSAAGYSSVHLCSLTHLPGLPLQHSSSGGCPTIQIWISVHLDVLWWKVFINDTQSRLLANCSLLKHLHPPMYLRISDLYYYHNSCVFLFYSY